MTNLLRKLFEKIIRISQYEVIKAKHNSVTIVHSVVFLYTVYQVIKNVQKTIKVLNDESIKTIFKHIIQINLIFTARIQSK